MDKHDLLRAMRDAHAPIEAAAATLSDDALHAAAPGVPGWTRKDVLAHLEWWHRHSTAVLGGLRTGMDPFPDEAHPLDAAAIDALNAQVHAEHRHRSGADVREGEAASFKALVSAVEAVPDDDLFRAGVVPWLDGTPAEMVAGDTFDHYAKHAAHLGG